LTPETFYTYQIVYLPDLTQKYGLRVKGGVGEMRATLNMVNGWMFTGPGPVYFHDSSTAETVSAYGTAVSGVLESAASFVSSMYGIPAGGGSAAAAGHNILEGQGKGIVENNIIKNYAELWVYEPVLVKDANVVGGERIHWRLLTGGEPTFKIDRDIVATNPIAPPAVNAAAAAADPYPSLTQQANTAIASLKLPDLTVLATSKTGDNYTIRVNRKIQPDEWSALLPKLPPGVVQFSVNTP
jgi:hypothetical protein